ncbi:S-adenosylmethionine:tRNA ribosyltransferase-isomerase [Kitasatospora sp. NBC_01250]|uniref:S-adenosylmethionine:tRNA ribosyltransferase-isomerase n=1 Tax=unclassified Kitasatospora TaxID=2633591 RepID=UPI002E0F4C19|nr:MULTISPECIES: S-adenosylmethionine:tRNA ribosyltransferase-isomerase [unclassified Kitasatospora]WSJ70849.1 S-adenosylmethionine:tRNA ribosyltransferase-isomerase [Kitasatospora sp. NBC_01302]
MKDLPDTANQYDFDFSSRLIAQQPAEVRGGARSAAKLLVLERAAGKVHHRRFDELGEFLSPDDVLVVNNARVVPSLLRGRDAHGSPVVVNVFSPMDDGSWHCLVLPASTAEVGAALRFGEEREVVGTLLRDEGAGVWRIAFEPGGTEVLDEIGEIAYPDYLVERPIDPAHYQTSFASRPGATLFPSAARHFTPELIEALKGRGTAVVEVTHHIAARWQHGYLRDWFGADVAWAEGADVEVPAGASGPSLPFPRPERYEVSTAAADEINDRRRAGGRIVVCGTSALRALETVADQRSGRVWPGTGWTNLILGPGHRFKACDAFLTNLHMPRSSELRLTSAFTGRQELLDLYRDEVVPNGYLFNEFGDSMLIA